MKDECDERVCLGQKLCLSIAEKREEYGIGIDEDTYPFPCDFGEIYSTAFTPSVEWFVADQQRIAERKELDAFVLASASSV